MSASLFVVQLFNGLQLGILLFLVAAGLTLVFGVMDFINLAHGVQYMLGAYLAVMAYGITGTFFLQRAPCALASLLFGLLLELLVFRHLYARDHLEQVLATFGIIMLLNQGGKTALGCSAPQPADPRNSVGIGAADGWAALSQSIASPSSPLACWSRPASICSSPQPDWHVGAGGRHQRGNGVGPRRRHQAVVHGGVRLRCHARRLCRGNGGANLSVEPGMGDQILILAFVVIVIGGIGSIRGAFLAAVLVGVIDTLGRSFMTDVLRFVLAPTTARVIGPALASMSIYLLMAVVLAIRPAGLFPAKGRA